jgi:polysaccharide biosynthesis/export protein
MLKYLGGSGNHHPAVAFFLMGAIVVGWAGCAATPGSRTATSVGLMTAGVNAEAAADSSSAERLAQLRAARASDTFTPTFALGPGDILEISAPDVEELKDRTVRVSTESTIELPVVGRMHAGALTERQFTEALRRQLSKYVKDPEVDVFVKQYYSRDVAVVGAVQKPGLYELTSPSDTLLDLINRAGGMTDRVAASMVFIPALASSHQGLAAARLLAASEQMAETPGDHQAPMTAVREAAVGTPEKPAGRMRSAHGIPTRPSDSVPLSYATPIKQEQAIVMTLAGPEGEEALDIPARPGDVIIIPGGGQVMVQGWVRVPGAYAVVNGMTVLGAVTAAGGELFSSSATLLRAGAEGRKIEMALDLSAIENAKAPDIPVQSGDVVLVNRSAVGAVPYFLYSLWGHFGAGVSAAPIY